MKRTPRTIPDYDAMFDPIRNGRRERSGKQMGDPVRAGKAMLAIIDSPCPPTRLLLGSDALRLVREKLAATADEIASWETLSRSTDG